MKQVALINIQPSTPALITNASEQAHYRYIDFFASFIRNAHTRRSYRRAAEDFLNWCEQVDVPNITAVRSLHVSAWVEGLGKELSLPTVKLRLAAIRHLFDWLVTGQIIPFNPASAVRGPRHSVKRGKTPVLAASEARELIDHIDISKLIGLRDRALIGVMIYTFARINAAASMKVEDVFTQNRRLWVRLKEKGGKVHEMPCHHTLEEYLYSYIEAGQLTKKPKSALFCTIGAGTGKLTQSPLPQSNAYRMIRRRAEAAGINTILGNHSFRATGITTYLKNGGSLETAAAMANHASIKTTQLYDRRIDNMTLDEIERIRI